MRNLLTQVENIAIEAGKLALSFQGDSTSVQYKDGLTESPVTAADYAVDAFLKERLTALNPSWGWLSEETVDDGNWQNTDKFWIVDPIDGTTGFVHFLEKGKSSVEAKNQRRQFSVSIALVAKNGTPILGVVYTPMDNTLMSAAENLGCFKNKESLKTCQSINTLGDFKGVCGTLSSSLNAYILLASTSEMRRGLIDFLVPHVNLKTVGSSANKIALVGVSDNCVSVSVKPKCWWDVAAAACIMNERGMILTDLSGRKMTFSGDVKTIDGIIAAPQPVYQALYDMMPRSATAGYV